MKKCFLVFFLLTPSMLFSQNLWSLWEIMRETTDTVYNRVEAYDYLQAMIVGDQGVVKTTYDGGESWFDLSSAKLGHLKYLEIFEDTLVLTGNEKTVYLSKNFGKSWTKIFEDSLGRINGISSIVDRLEDIRFNVFGRDSLAITSLNFGSNWLPAKKNNYFLNSHDLVWYESRRDIPNVTDVVMINRSGGVSSFNEKIIHSYSDMFKPDTQRIVTCLQTNHWKSFAAIHYATIFLTARGEFIMNAQKPDEFTDSFVTCASYLRYQGTNREDSSITILVGKNGMLFGRESNELTILPYETVAFPKVTNKDLKWIDVAPNRNHADYHDWNKFTFYTIGDDIILRKRYNWKPGDAGTAQRRSQVMGLDLFPNPSKGAATLQFLLRESTQASINVYNTTGIRVVEVFKGNMANGFQSHSLPADLPKGLYLVRLKTENLQATRKWLVE